MSGRSFEARYPGRCANCDDGISVGETLVYDEDDQVIHADCIDRSNDRLHKPPEICPRCFLAKSTTGACGCDPE